MRRSLVLLAGLVLVSVPVGAADLTILQPGDTTVTEPFPPLQVNWTGEGEVFYTLNDGERRQCDCIDQLVPLQPVEGDNTVRVLVERSGTVTETASTSFTVDTEPPSITGISPQGASFDATPRIVVDYTDTASGVDPEGTSIALDGEELELDTATASQAVASISRELSPGTHTLEVTVKDSSGHARTNTTTFNLPEKPSITTTRPTGTIAVPSRNVSLTARTPTGIDTTDSMITITGVSEATIDFERSFSGAELRSRTRGEKVTVRTPDLRLPDGRFKVEASLSSEGSNRSTEASWTFTADTTPPTITSLSHSGGDIVNGEETFWLEADDSDSAVERASFTLAGRRHAVTGQSGDRFETAIQTTELPDGRYNLTVRAQDSAGNLGEDEIEVGVDNAPPEFRSGPDIYPATSHGRLVVSGEAVDAGSRIERIDYAVRGTDRSGSLHPAAEFEDVIATGLEDGEYFLQLTLTDATGHASTASSWFEVDSSVDAGISLRTPDLSVVDGQERSTSLTVLNTGYMPEQVSLNISDHRVNHSPDRLRLQPGEEGRFVLSLQGDEVGSSQVSITAQGLASEDSISTPLIVRPPKERRQEIEERYAELRDQVLSGETRNETHVEAIGKIKTLLEQERYGEAVERMDRIDISTTDTSLTGRVAAAASGISLVTILLSTLFAVFFILGSVPRLTRDTAASEITSVARASLEEFVESLRSLSREEKHQVDEWDGYEG